VRTFAALPLPAQAVQMLEKLAAELKSRFPGLKVVKAHGMHVTMVFFGELAQEQVLEVMRVMDSRELKVASIQAAIGGVGVFPPRGRPRVIYCPVRRGGPEIGDLYRLFVRLLSRNDSLRSAVAELGTEERRDFIPHITLARCKETRISLGGLEELFRFESSLILDRLVLYQSILRPQGAEYRALKTVTFG
jgi:2'-5' RNA ligase